MPHPRDSLISLLHQHRRRIIRDLERKFSKAGTERAEDAFQQAIEHAYNHLDLYQQLFDGGGEQAAVKRLRVVAWRALRGELRKFSHSRRAPLDAAASETDGRAGPEDHMLALALTEELRPLLPLVARRCGGRHPEKLLAALEEKLNTLDADTRICRKHGIPREYLGKARRMLQRMLSAA